MGTTSVTLSHETLADLHEIRAAIMRAQGRTATLEEAMRLAIAVYRESRAE